jgi:hypothetical protein
MADGTVGKYSKSIRQKLAEALVRRSSPPNAGGRERLENDEDGPGRPSPRNVP